jgi:hypothetical protein
MCPFTNHSLRQPVIGADVGLPRVAQSSLDIWLAEVVEDKAHLGTAPD